MDYDFFSEDTYKGHWKLDGSDPDVRSVDLIVFAAKYEFEEIFTCCRTLPSLCGNNGLVRLARSKLESSGLFLSLKRKYVTLRSVA